MVELGTNDLMKCKQSFLHPNFQKSSFQILVLMMVYVSDTESQFALECILGKYCRHKYVFYTHKIT